MKTKNRNWLFPLIVIGLVLILTHSCKKDEEPADKITDKDGNVYTSVTIGTQVWMVENLKTTKYNDGTTIQNITDDAAWGNLATGAFCWYNNEIGNKSVYGALYNAWAVTTGKLCPSGWHVPSHSEWITLIEYAGGINIAGGKLKETGTSHWNSPNTGATDDFGFEALPGGYRSVGDNHFVFLGIQGKWWTTTPGTQGVGLNGFYMRNQHANAAYDYGYNPIHGISVRCIED